MGHLERQKSWGWVAATYIFLAGVGGGVFLSSFILDFLGSYGPIARIGALWGPLLVLMGTLFLLVDLGAVRRVYRLFFTPSAFMASWMVKGAWILAVFIILGLAYALPSFEAFGWLPWNKTSDWGRGIGIAAALLSILVAIYPGFLLGVVNGIPSWHASVLPPLFFFLALDTGIALLVLIALFFPITFGAAGFHQLGIADIAFILMQLIALGAFLETVRHLGVTGTATIRLLKTPLFIGGVIILGLLLPLALLLYTVLVTDGLTLRILAGITSALLLAGGLFLRYSIIKTGVYFGLR